MTRTYIDNIFFVFLVSAVMGSGFAYYKLYLFHIVLVVLIASIGIAYLRKQQHNFEFSNNAFVLFWLINLAWYIFSLIWTINILYTLKYLVFLLFGFLIIFFIVSYSATEEKYKRAFKPIAITFIVGLAFCLLESFSSFRWPADALYKYFDTPNNNSLSFANIYANAQHSSKSSSFWGFHNTVSCAISLLLPFFLMLKNPYYKYIGALLVLIVIAMNGTRGVLIAYFIGLLAYFLVTRHFKQFIVIASIIIGATFVITPSINYLHKIGIPVDRLATSINALSNYIYLSDKPVDGSVRVRKQLIVNGLEAFEASKGLGVGGGASVAVQESKGGHVAYIKTMHNLWIELLTEGGIIGFLMFFVWYVLVTFNLLKIHLKTTNDFFKYHSGALALAMLIFAIACMSVSIVIYFFPMWILFGLASAICLLYRQENNKPVLNQ